MLSFASHVCLLPLKSREYPLQLVRADHLMVFMLFCRACPVRNPHGPGGGEPVPPLHSEPKATGGVHRPTTLLPAGEGVQHQPFPAGGEPLGVQWD